MKKELLNIINNSDEPVYELDAYISNQKEIEKRDLLWDSVRKIALNGNVNQRFIALTVISVNKTNFLESLSLELIKNNNFPLLEPILKPIVNICSTIGKEEHIKYLLEVFHYALINNKEYLYEITLRNIIATNSWKKIIDKIKAEISNSDDLTIIDLMAYFIHKQGLKEYSYLLNCLSESKYDKLMQLEDKISRRLNECYPASPTTLL